jgi:hypothetical protein
MGDQHVHTFHKMFITHVYPQTRHVSVQLGTIIRGGIENKTLVIKHQRSDTCRV